MLLTTQEFKAIFAAWAQVMGDNKTYLIDLDSVVGDGDLGLTMSDGFAAAAKNAQEQTGDDLGNLFYFAGKAMATAVPSTMGTLMASGLMEVGKALKKSAGLDLTEFYKVPEAFMNGVMSRGKAKVGDKTVLDGLYPAVEALKKASPGCDMAAILDEASRQAAEGAQNTTTMLAVHGRAATRGEQSRTLLDPGAVVAKLLVEAACGYLKTLL